LSAAELRADALAIGTAAIRPFQRAHAWVFENLLAVWAIAIAYFVVGFALGRWA